MSSSESNNKAINDLIQSLKDDPKTQKTLLIKIVNLVFFKLIIARPKDPVDVTTVAWLLISVIKDERRQVAKYLSLLIIDNK